METKPKIICVSEPDMRLVRDAVDRALKSLAGITLEYARLLENELDQAEIVPASCLPKNVVALNSKVWVTDRDFNEKMVLTIVMPEKADGNGRRVSILSPLGMALFGYEAGDILDWGPLYRRIRLLINRVMTAGRIVKNGVD